ncbi:tetratricopeptide repeat protein [bacterium]|nr:tetratricopeptide repeat protein [bacterium]
MGFSERKKHLSNLWPGIFIIALVTICIYSNIYHSPLVFDDLRRIEQNLKIRDLSNYLFPIELLKPRHIVDLTFALNYKFGKLNVFGYHLINVLIHVLNGFLVYFLALAIFRKISICSEFHRLSDFSISVMSLFTALIFIVHPIQTQAVTYTVQRYASMAAMFYMASVLFYLKARIIQQGAERRAHGAEIRGQRSEVRGRRTEFKVQREELKAQSSRLKGRTRPKSLALNFELSTFYFLSILCGMLAFLSKQNTASLPGIILLVEYLLIDMTWQGWKKKIPWFALTFVLWVFFAAYVSGLFSGGIGEGGLLEDVSERMMETEKVSRWRYLCTQFNVLVIYIRLLFLPVKQNLDYLYAFKSGFIKGYTPLAFSCIAGIIVLSIGLIKKHVIVSFGIFWFFITLSVESSIIPIRDALFEHRLYLPMVGFNIIAACVIFNFLSSKQTWVIPILISIIIPLGTASYLRNKVWQDPVVLWSDVLSKNNRSYRAHNNLGIAFKNKGYSEEALVHFSEALRIRPRYADVQNNLGVIHAGKGNFNEAMRHYSKALRIKPDFAEAHNNLGVALKQQGNLNAAISHYLESIRINPDYAEAYNNLGIVLVSQGRYREAVKHYSIALRIKPNHAEIQNNLGNAMMGAGEVKEAIGHYLEALQIKPNYAEAYYNLGAAHANQGDYQGAKYHYLEALRINPDYMKAHLNLAEILKKQGRFEETIGHYLEALRINPDQAETHYKMGNFLKNEGRLEEAIYHYKEALRINPKFPEAHNNIGNTLMGRGNFREAIHHYEEALRIRPDFVIARKNLETIFRLMGQSTEKEQTIVP